MYSFIKGNIATLLSDMVVIDHQGIGYEIQIGQRTHEWLRELDKAMIYVQLIVREDGHYLYGFRNLQDRMVFNKLISVSGIGPNTARTILSSLTSQEVVGAILTDRHDVFKKVKGVGPKTAKRISLDLKDKLNDITFSEDPASAAVLTEKQAENGIRKEAMAALIHLGFKKKLVQDTLTNLLAQENTEDLRLEDLIRSALAMMTGNNKS